LSLLINTLYQTRKKILLILFSLFSSFLFGQQKEAADNLVSEGVVLQDRGEVDSAMAKFNEALALDKDNLLALSEMAYSYLSIEKYNDAVDYCKRAIKKHPEDHMLKSAYVCYGNALDALGKTGKSIDIYNEGTRLFPEYYQLYYNRGISQNKLNKTKEALMSFQQSVALNPAHASSHNAIGHLLFNNNNIPSLLAFCRFLILEPNSGRSAGNLSNVKKIMGEHVTKTDENNITIHVSPEMLDSKPGEKKNSFSSAELMLSLNSALDNDSSNANQTDTEKFIRKFSALCTYLKETEKDNYGFYWEYYVPYFTELNDKGHVTTLAYIIFTASGNAEVAKWLDVHKNETDEFYQWSEGFKWRID
jgi:tetratricopeptide (TPR) repeat protein